MSRQTYEFMAHSAATSPITVVIRSHPESHDLMVSCGGNDPSSATAATTRRLQLQWAAVRYTAWLGIATIDERPRKRLSCLEPQTLARPMASLLRPLSSDVAHLASSPKSLRRGLR